MKTRVTLKNEMHFEGDLEGFKIHLDADEQFGGKNKGPKPKGLILTALAGCTSMDVISILRKMRAEPEDFYVEVDANIKKEQPQIFENILITYFFKGNKITEEKAKKAIDLSLNTYCSVSAMLKKTVKIDYKIEINNKK